MYASAETAQRNRLTIHLVRMDVVSALRPGTVDLLVCHPPYVPTDDELLGAAKAKASTSADNLQNAAWTWAGGPGGTAVLDALLASLPAVLSPRGVAYVLFFEAEAFGADRLAARGLDCTLVSSYSAPGETFVVMRIERTLAAACQNDQSMRSERERSSHA